MLIYSTPGTGKTEYLKYHVGYDGDHLLLRELKKALSPSTEIPYQSNGTEIGEWICSLYKLGHSELIEKAYLNYEYVLSNHLTGSDKPLCLFGSVRLMHLAEKIYLEQDEDLLRQRGKKHPRRIINNELSEITANKLQYETLNGKFISDVLSNTK